MHEGARVRSGNDLSVNVADRLVIHPRPAQVVRGITLGALGGVGLWIAAIGLGLALLI